VTRSVPSIHADQPRDDRAGTLDIGEEVRPDAFFIGRFEDGKEAGHRLAAEPIGVLEPARRFGIGRTTVRARELDGSIRRIGRAREGGEVDHIIQQIIKAHDIGAGNRLQTDRLDHGKHDQARLHLSTSCTSWARECSAGDLPVYQRSPGAPPPPLTISDTRAGSRVQLSSFRRELTHLHRIRRRAHRPPPAGIDHAAVEVAVLGHGDADVFRAS
jgi:hypothetical protein